MDPLSGEGVYLTGSAAIRAEAVELRSRFRGEVVDRPVDRRGVDAEDSGGFRDCVERGRRVAQCLGGCDLCVATVGGPDGWSTEACVSINWAAGPNSALKQRELAERSGMSLAIVREIQQGKVHRNRNPRTLEALSVALQRHPQHLTAVLAGKTHRRLVRLRYRNPTRSWPR